MIRCADDKKGVRVVATACNVGESGVNNGEGNENATVGDERKSEGDKFQRSPF